MNAVMALAIVTALAGPARAAADRRPPPRESAAFETPDQQARNLFRAQRYPEALAIYQRLRAETHHPTYLRNIGRCHQMMGQPAPAIDAFEGYLREARELDAAERAEIEGYIAEMRRLELAMPPPATGAGPAAVTTAAATEPAGHAPSLLHRWWFWTGVAALATAAVVIVVASSGEDRLPCPTGAVCP